MTYEGWSRTGIRRNLRQFARLFRRFNASWNRPLGECHKGSIPKWHSETFMLLVAVARILLRKKESVRSPTVWIILQRAFAFLVKATYRAPSSVCWLTIDSSARRVSSGISFQFRMAERIVSGRSNHTLRSW